jgi:hypothetical protein
MLFWIVIVLVLGVAAYLAASAYGFRAYAGQLARRLAESQLEPAIAGLGKADQALIPDLMRAYAERCGGRVDGPRLFRATQKAEMRTAPGKPFFPIAAEQTTGTRDPGFVWTAAGAMPPGIPVSGLDAYVAGAGDFEMRLAGVLPVATAGDAAAAIGELQRYLSELPVYPDAILNAQGLVWRTIDPHRVEVTAESHYGPATVVFRFDDSGDIAGLEALRPRSLGGGRTELTPWRGTYGDYRNWGAYRVPSHGEVGWELPDGLFVYWRGDLVSYAPV